jgi:hypothetical protein
MALASKGVQVTIVDLKVEQGEESVRLVEEEHTKISYKPKCPSALFIRCDITNTCMLQEYMTHLHLIATFSCLPLSYFLPSAIIGCDSLPSNTLRSSQFE